MNKENDYIDQEAVFTGRGEFELKDVSVVAEVEVRNGIVQKTEFSAILGIDPSDVDQIISRLQGKPISVALEVKPCEVDSSEEHRGENVGDVALLEAFHRAVEGCFDDE
ncbi:MAG: hypothetical protein GY854_11680 [Deltaproteobacteria bacterium]|nr:hypothetical protein [Deltaproteobacteria bacterium]